MVPQQPPSVTHGRGDLAYQVAAARAQQHVEPGVNELPVRGQRPGPLSMIIPYRQGYPGLLGPQPEAGVGLRRLPRVAAGQPECDPGGHRGRRAGSITSGHDPS